MARCQVVHQKHEADSKLIDKLNHNAVLDICHYDVELPGVDITELAVNFIAVSMYAQVDMNGNEYLLLKAFIDHKRGDSTLIVEDQKVMVKRREIIRMLMASWDSR